MFTGLFSIYTFYPFARKTAISMSAVYIASSVGHSQIGIYLKNKIPRIVLLFEISMSILTMPLESF